MNDVEFIIPGWNGWGSPSGRVIDTMKIWMDENNIKATYNARTRKGETLYCYIQFSNEEDAMAFKLRWT